MLLWNAAAGESVSDGNCELEGVSGELFADAF